MAGSDMTICICYMTGDKCFLSIKHSFTQFAPTKMVNIGCFVAFARRLDLSLTGDGVTSTASRLFAGACDRIRF
jgi:hypothetical protein